MSNLGKAIKLAAVLFEDKIDKSGEPYILHCLRVMNNVSPKNRIPAVLHDVVEDTDMMIEDLVIRGFSREDVAVIELLTFKKGGDYMEQIKKIALCPRATEIKLADLIDNSQITRLKGLTKKDFDRVQKYHTAYTYLSKI